MIARNENGMTLMEIMVATGILGAVIYIFMGSSRFIGQNVSKVKNQVVINRAVMAYYENIKSNVSVYQITSDPSEFLEMTSRDELHDKLPIAWSKDTITEVENCKQCRGRMGYVITPHSEYRGLYKLTIRATHTELISNFTEYDFIISGM